MNDKKILHDLTKESDTLIRDVKALEDALFLHKTSVLKDETSAKGMIRKEIDGSRWQYGGTGKLSGFRSAKDLDNPLGKRERTKSSSATDKTKKGGKTDGLSSREQGLEPSVDKVTSSRPGTAKTRPPSARKSLGEDFSRVKPRGERVRSTSAEPGKTQRSRSADRPRMSLGGSVSSARSQMTDRTNRPLVGTAKAEKIKAASKGLKYNFDQENGMSLPMKVTVTKKDSSGPSVRSVKTGVCATDSMKEKLNFEENAPSSKSKTDEDSCTSLTVAGLQSKRTELGIHKDIRKCDPHVALWIYELNLKDPEKYIRIFGEQEVDMESLKLINEKHLKVIGITAVGPLNKIMQGIRDLRGETFERYLEQFDTSRMENLKVQGHGQKGRRERGESCPGKKTAGKAPQEKRKQGELDGRDSERIEKEKTKGKCDDDKGKGDSLDTIPVKEPKETSVGQKNSYQLKETISSFQKKRERLLEVKKTAREKLATEKKIEKEKAMRKKTGVPVQNRDFEGDTAVGHYGQDVSSAEHTPRDKPATATNPPSEIHLEPKPTETDEPRLGNPWSGRRSSAEDPDVALKSIEEQVRGLKLQGRANEAVTKDLLEKLQGQLKAIQVQVADKQDKEAFESAKKALEAADDKAAPLYEPKYPMISQPLLSSTFLHPGRTSLSRPKSSVLTSLTKNELITEVRKQKQEYNKQLKHLETELSRLKHKDPVKSCELPREEVIFNEDDLIGEGAFSKVYRGSFQGAEVAVKRLSVPLERHDKNYFAAEVSLLRELRHPHVVLLVGVCTTSTLPLMVLEYMGGGSLYDVLHDDDKPPLDHVAFYNIAKDIALGMNYLHRHRPAVLHLDLKSMNVLLSLHERAKIADFGFSKLRHEADMAASRQGQRKSTVKGTPAWMAPEMLSGGEVTIKADVYSFGMILWEMFTREHPYDGCSTFQVLERLRTNKRPFIPEDCPPSLHELITTCWSHNPARRAQFKDILVKLEDLTFPPEWRTLFDAANVPKLALEDIESAREIVGFVNTTLERDLEKLHLKHPEVEKTSPVPQLDLKLIDLEDGEDEVEDVKAANDAVPEAKSSPKPDEADHVSLDSWNSDISDTEEAEPIQEAKIPPAPPLPISVAPVPDNASETVPNDVKFVKAPPVGANEPRVNAEDLVAQRNRLRATTQLHPNQLRDLKEVPVETLSNIAMILREAVEKRRLAMKEGGTTDRSSEVGAWSTAESSRPETFRTEEN